MQKQTNQMHCKISAPSVVRVVGAVGIVLLCFAALSFTTFYSALPIHATNVNGAGSSSSGQPLIPASTSGTGSATSSPSSGPVGTTIAVSGSGWPMADGTQASFGYMVSTTCSIVADSQIGIIHAGNFNGWFRWPHGTALSTYTVCVVASNTTAVAGSFSVLSSSPPQVSISPTLLIENQSASVTASNYFPAGTTVSFLWATQNNQVEFALNSAVSNSNGVATVNFTVPVTRLASGLYMIEAVVGAGQPATLYSATNFAYNAPASQPSPTPSATPSSSPTPSQTPTQVPDPTPANTPTAQASATPTAGATLTPVVTQNTGGNQTPITNTPTAVTSKSGGSGGTSTGNPPNTLFLIAGVVSSLLLLITLVIIALVLRRRRTSRLVMPARTIPPTFPGDAGAIPWSNPQGVFMNNGGMPANGFNSFQPAGPPPLISSQRSPVLPAANTFPGPGGNGMMPMDPALEAMRRQVQSGLFAEPRSRPDGRSPQ